MGTVGTGLSFTSHTHACAYGIVYVCVCVCVCVRIIYRGHARTCVCEVKESPVPTVPTVPIRRCGLLGTFGNLSERKECPDNVCADFSLYRPVNVE